MQAFPGGFEQVSTCFPPEYLAGGLSASGGMLFFVLQRYAQLREDVD